MDLTPRLSKAIGVNDMRFNLPQSEDMSPQTQEPLHRESAFSDGSFMIGTRLKLKVRGSDHIKLTPLGCVPNDAVGHVLRLKRKAEMQLL
jgi:predicted nucleotide-binding protein (sugar kinase/HSP70/actin superfamily)